jgi:hypothetical protein
MSDVIFVAAIVAFFAAAAQLVRAFGAIAAGPVEDGPETSADEPRRASP